MFVPCFSVGLSLVIVGLVGAQTEKDGATYPPEDTSASPASSASMTAPDGYPGCYVASPHWIGDGWCDSFANYNTEACGYDGGDCCECDCSNAEFDCGVWSYDCVDPDSNCPSECSNGFAGFEASNDVGSVCCPLGCNQCGGAGCGQAGAGQDLDNTDCCINGVLNNQDSCDVTGAAPCILKSGACIDGIDGILGENDNGSVCCPDGCTQCGGAGCASAGAAAGLGNTDCCINGILNNQDPCESTGAAPCTL